jgi:hypothetical protein
MLKIAAAASADTRYAPRHPPSKRRVACAMFNFCAFDHWRFRTGRCDTIRGLEKTNLAMRRLTHAAADRRIAV